VQCCIQFLSRFEVPAKGFFDNDAPPPTVGFFRQPGLAQLVAITPKKLGGVAR
jgi:hypothetical protein